MKKQMVIITNNPKCYESFKKNYSVEYYEDATYGDILVKVRDLIYEGYDLLTHPLAGSVKPNLMPYRTILLSNKQESKEKFYQDCKLITNSIETLEKFLNDNGLRDWSDDLLIDFQDVDHSLIEGVVNKYY